MKTMPKKYDTVCANGNANATVWRVVDLMPPMVGIVDTTLPEEKQQIQWTDRSLIERATRAQLQNAGLV